MSVASKNLYDLLGNDDGDDTPSGPVKTVDKTSMRSTKRGVEPEAPVKAATSFGAGRRGNASGTGSEAAFRDRNAGSDRNRGKTTDESARGGQRGGYGARVRGGRGGRFPRERDDRHAKGPPSGSEKQAGQSWGATEGEAEMKDEQAGEAIAQAEQKDAAAEAGANDASKDIVDVEPEEPEEKQVSYEEYLAQQAEKKAALESQLEVRKANEGTKPDKKWAAAKELVKDTAEEFMMGTGGKAKRERERKTTKQVLEIDNRFVEPERSTRGGGVGGFRGGRGGPRGGGRGDRADRGDGGDRPERSERAERGEYRGRGRGRGEHRGDHRGDHRGAHRGEHRGDRGGPRRDNTASGPINTNDTSAFPTLGGK